MALLKPPVVKRALAVLFLFLSTGLVWAESFPDRTIRLIVPFPPGGTTDIVARILAEPLGKELGQPIVVQNKAGSGGSLGTIVVTRAEKDGYTIGMASNSTHIANPLLQKETTYDPIRDFSLLGGIGSVANVLVVNPGKVPVKNMDELLALVRSHPSRYTCASAGNGSMGHLWLANFEYASKTDIPHVPYRGAAPALDNLLSGQSDMMFDNLPSALPHIQAGRLVPVAIAASKRSDLLPDVPTFNELGLEGANLDGWFGLVGPAGIPAPVRKKFNDALLRVLEQPAVIARLREQGAEAQGATQQVFTNNLKFRLEKMREVVQAGRISLD